MSVKISRRDKVTTAAKVKLGYEMPTGDEVAIPVRHMIVAGQTQRSGKTTTLEALISRASTTALAFVTKRGEGSFEHARKIPPYFRDVSGGRPYWEFVESIVSSAMGQKMKFERAWIMKAARGAHSLQGVRDNLDKLQKKATRSMDQDIYMLLAAYLDIVLPQIEKFDFRGQHLDLQPGLSVMDLTMFTEEMQMLIVRSCLVAVHDNARNVITIIPEAWKFVPEGRMTPVKPAAERLVREGAGLHNFVWIDSQDIAGVSKLLLRAATVWLIGVQREANELRRTLQNIPEGIKKPRAADVAMLGVGEFFACFDESVHRTYVQPAWLSDGEAYSVAAGIRSVNDIVRTHNLRTEMDVIDGKGGSWDGSEYATYGKVEEESAMTKNEEQTLRDENARLQARITELERSLRGSATPMPGMPLSKSVAAIGRPSGIPLDDSEYDALYSAIKQRLVNEAPTLLKVLVSKPELEVTVTRSTVEADGKSWVGRVASLIAEGYFDGPRKSSEVFREATRRGATGVAPRADEACKKLLAMGFLTRESDGFQAVRGMKVNIVEV